MEHGTQPQTDDSHDFHRTAMKFRTTRKLIEALHRPFFLADAGLCARLREGLGSSHKIMKKSNNQRTKNITSDYLKKMDTPNTTKTMKTLQDATTNRKRAFLNKFLTSKFDSV
jgi:NADH:ubiquinone oxidoreductase subunit F (NADH-binding)